MENDRPCMRGRLSEGIDQDNIAYQVHASLFRCYVFDGLRLAAIPAVKRMSDWEAVDDDSVYFFRIGVEERVPATRWTTLRRPFSWLRSGRPSSA